MNKPCITYRSPPAVQRIRCDAASPHKTSNCRWRFLLPPSLTSLQCCLSLLVTHKVTISHEDDDDNDDGDDDDNDNDDDELYL